MSNSHNSSELEHIQIESMLLAVYYRGKDGNGYNDFELAKDVAAIQSLITQARLSDWHEIDAAYDHAMTMDFDVRTTNDMHHLIRDRIFELQGDKK